MRRAPLLLVVAAAFASFAARADAVGGDLRVRPDPVVFGLVPAAARIEATAVVPAGARAIFTLRGPRARFLVRRRHHLAGLLWVDRDERVLEELPSVLLVRGWPRPASPADLRAAGIETAPEHADAVEALRAAGLHGEDDSPRATRNGRAAVSFLLPDAAPPGEYAVSVRILTADGPVDEVVRVTVRRSGAVSFLARLARAHPALHGLAAVLVAVAIGLLAGLLRGFGSRIQ